MADAVERARRRVEAGGGWEAVAALRQAERDQLRQQVEKLLGAVQAMADEPFGFREEEETRLYKAADQIRKELG